MSRSYYLATPVPDAVHAALAGYDDLTKQLLFNRGVTEPEAVQQFLNPSYDTDRHDPFLLNDMERAVRRVLRAIVENEKVMVYSDYDCDGIPGAVVVHDFFKAIGFQNFEHYIPHRHYEGFGFSAYAVEKIAHSGTTLIITIDCGTSDHEAVDAAARYGIDVIVTDHHEPHAAHGPAAAAAVVNPKLGGTYPFDGLCGAAVVFKLVEALIARGNFAIKPGWEKWWLDMVGIATIGDLVPLTGENRVFARFGLDVLRKSRRPGLQHLFRKTRTSQRYLTEDDIGFTIAPRINAASRMDTPEDAFHMLAATDEADAGVHVAHLEKLNNERKGLVASMTKELKKRIHDMVEIPDVLVLGSPEWRPSLAGLAANSLAETYRRPAFIWGRDGNGVVKGSCRSEGSSSVVTLMNAATHLFLEHGGHHMSGGFSVRDEHIYTFGDTLNTTYRDLGTAAVVQEEQMIDAELALTDIASPLLRALASLAPFGMGNPKPLFSFREVTPVRVDVFGKAKEHLKLVFDVNGRDVEAIAFFATPTSFAVEPAVGQAVTLIAHVEQSFFMGRMQIRLRIVDIVNKNDINLADNV